VSLRLLYLIVVQVLVDPFLELLTGLAGGILHRCLGRRNALLKRVEPFPVVNRFLGRARPDYRCPSWRTTGTLDPKFWAPSALSFGAREGRRMSAEPRH
jgi:hypothetical protein